MMDTYHILKEYYANEATQNYPFDQWLVMSILMLIKI